MTAADVITGDALWSAECGDCVPWLRSLPDRCVSLVFFSPPYEGQRLYLENGVIMSRPLTGQAWVDWMREVIVASARASAGLVAVNASSPREDGCYTASVEWLVADLTRRDGLVCGPAPYVWVKSEDYDDASGNGTPGSGGNHYHRRDWEPVYCFALPDRIPGAKRNKDFWSDNTAFGRPPKYGAGGDPSHRRKDGTRANDPWKTASRGGSGCGGRRPDGKKQRGPKNVKRDLLGEPLESGEPSLLDFNFNGRKVDIRHTKTLTNGEKKKQGYVIPPVSNPGNVLADAIMASDVLRVPVGGGKLGCSIAHNGEAPMALGVAERFICWYVPPDGVVCDPFSGTGTTGHAAILHGRRAIMCDLRQSQIDLIERRMTMVQPEMFA